MVSVKSSAINCKLLSTAPVSLWKTQEFEELLSSALQTRGIKVVQAGLNLGSLLCRASFARHFNGFICHWDGRIWKESGTCRCMLSPGWPAHWTLGFQHKTPAYPSARKELSSLDFTLLPISTLLSIYSIFLTTSMCSILTLLSFPKG